jgi:hypothetical protein
VKKIIIPISMGLMCLSFTIIPPEATIQQHSKVLAESSPSANKKNVHKHSITATLIYSIIQLKEYGLSQEAFSYAWEGYMSLMEKKLIPLNKYLTICDFSQSSLKKRLYIIDIENQKLLFHTYVAHGIKSGGEFATKFSNIPESLQSSLGFYITSTTYIGEHGLSLRIRGVDPGFNDNALKRNIVIHGAAYVNEARARSGTFMGRSFGCPAVPEKESRKIISAIKNGSCFFIYHPDKKYFSGSKILNG